MTTEQQESLADESALHASRQQLDAALPHIQASPLDAGELQLIVRRPAKGQREVVSEAQLDEIRGLVGDNWLQRGSSATPNGSAHPDMQINIMNARAIAAIAIEKSRWALAGDQLYIDLDLSEANLPPGTRLAIGDTLLEISAEPHLGCKSFSGRFGRDAVMFVNSDIGKALHLRGLNARIVRGGTVRTGDIARKV